MSNHKIVGSGEVTSDSTKNTYSIEYYLKEDDLGAYVPAYGDVASWAPVPARVTRFRKTELAGDRYLLSIEAEPDETAGLFGNTGRIEIEDKIEWKYEDRELYYHPKLWGVRRATQRDVDKGAKNIYEKTAKAKDFIYKNYVDDTSKLQGSPDYSESPFSAKNHPPIKLIGQKREIAHFIVVFYSKKAPKILRRFCGINGKFPAALEVYNGGTPGKWRLRKQELESFQSEGKNYVKVTRTFGYAFAGLWDPEKCIGYWRSWEMGGLAEK